MSKLRILYNSLVQPNRNQDAQEATTLKFLYVTSAEPHRLTLKQFKEDLSVALAKKLGRPRVEISYMTTVDGFELDSDYSLLSEVLQSNSTDQRLEDTVVVYDARCVNRRQMPLIDLTEPLHLMEEADTGDNIKKTVLVGLHQHGKMFVRFLVGSTIAKFYLFSPEQLSDIRSELASVMEGQEGLDIAERPLGFHNAEDEYYANLDIKVATTKVFKDSKWEISAKFVLTRKDLSADHFMHVLVSVKTSNGEEPTAFLVPLEWTDFRVVRKGTAVPTTLSKLYGAGGASNEVEIDTSKITDLPFKLRQSSSYSSCGNTFEALQDEAGENGAGTESENQPFVQASFEHPHTVTGIQIRPLLQSGWGLSYLAGAFLTYSQDELEWKTALQLTGLTDAVNTVAVPNISAPYWRIRKDSGYLAIGFLKFLGVPSTEPLPKPTGKPIEYYQSLFETKKSTTREGVELAIVPRPTCQKYQDSGDSNLHLLIAEDEQKKIDTLVEPTQDSYASEGKFKNYFKFPVTIINKANTDLLSILKLEMRYKTHSGEWAPMSGVRLGARYQGWRGDWEYSWFDSHVVNFKSGQAETLAVLGNIEVEGTPGSTFNTRARAHGSLPQPLVIKLILEDSENKVREICVEQGNRPLDLTSPEELAKNNSLDLAKVRMVTCDDANELERYYTAIYLKGRDFIIKLSTGTYYTYSYQNIKNLEATAKKDGKTEVEIDSCKTSTGNVSFLYDAESDYKAYAARISLKTATSKIEEVVSIRDLFDELARN